MNFVDTTAFKGNRFEVKQNLNFLSDLSKQNINFQYLELLHAHNPSVFKGFIKLEGKKIRNLRNTNDSCEINKNVSEFKINPIYRGYTVISKLIKSNKTSLLVTTETGLRITCKHC